MNNAWLGSGCFPLYPHEIHPVAGIKNHFLVLFANILTAEHVGRAMGASNGGQKRTWGVANGNRGYTLQSSVESIPAAADDEGSSPRYKRLNREQTSLLNAVVDRSHDSEFSVDDSSLPRPTPPKGTFVPYPILSVLGWSALVQVSLWP